MVTFFITKHLDLRFKVISKSRARKICWNNLNNNTKKILQAPRASLSHQSNLCSYHPTIASVLKACFTSNQRHRHHLNLQQRSRRPSRLVSNRDYQASPSDFLSRLRPLHPQKNAIVVFSASCAFAGSSSCASIRAGTIRRAQTP